MCKLCVKDIVLPLFMILIFPLGIVPTPLGIVPTPLGIVPTPLGIVPTVWFILFCILFMNTVKSVLTSHLWDKEKVTL